jgi:hypothetical protein
MLEGLDISRQRLLPISPRCSRKGTRYPRTRTFRLIHYLQPPHKRLVILSSTYIASQLTPILAISYRSLSMPRPRKQKNVSVGSWSLTCNLTRKTCITSVPSEKRTLQNIVQPENQKLKRIWSRRHQLSLAEDSSRPRLLLNRDRHSKTKPWVYSRSSCTR